MLLLTSSYTSHASFLQVLTLHMLFPYKFLHFTCFSLQLLTLHMLLLTDSYTSHACSYRSLHFTCLFLQILTLLTSPYMTSRYYCKKMSFFLRKSISLKEKPFSCKKKSQSNKRVFPQVKNYKVESSFLWIQVFELCQVHKRLFPHFDLS